MFSRPCFEFSVDPNFGKLKASPPEVTLLMPGYVSYFNSALVACLSVILLVAAISGQTSENLRGTLVVAVPVPHGLVVCSDKRLYNEAANSFRDDYVKIHKVSDRTLFVATHTTGFLDPRTGKMEFDIFNLTSRYVAQHRFAPDRQFWDGLKDQIHDQLLTYLSKQKYEDWPATDVANNKLLFNLVFYSVESSSAHSYSMSVFYEKAPTPIIFTQGVTSEVVKTPELLGKGKDVMAYLSNNLSLSGDPSILRFDQSNFKIAQTTVPDAVNFARKLFVVTNAALPQAEVSAAHDCALLSFQSGFQWITETGQPRP